MKTWLPTDSAIVFLRCAPTARTISDFAISDFDRFRFEMIGIEHVATGSAQHQFAVQHHAHNRVIHVPHNGAVVDKENIGDATEPLQGFTLIRANRLVAEIAARGDDGKTKQMVHRRIRLMAR